MHSETIDAQAEGGSGLTETAARLAAEVSDAVDAQPCTLLHGGRRHPEICQEVNPQEPPEELPFADLT